MTKVTEARKIIKQLELLTQSVKRFTKLRDEVRFGRNNIAKEVGVGSYLRTLDRRMMGQAHAEERMWKKLESICIGLDPKMFKHEDFSSRDLSLIRFSLDLLPQEVERPDNFYSCDWDCLDLDAESSNPPSEGEVNSDAERHESNLPVSNPPEEGEARVQGKATSTMTYFDEGRVVKVAKTDVFNNSKSVRSTNGRRRLNSLDVF